MRVCLETKQQMKTRVGGAGKEKAQNLDALAHVHTGHRPRGLCNGLAQPIAQELKFVHWKDPCVPVGLTLLSSKNSFRDGSCITSNPMVAYGPAAAKAAAWLCCWSPSLPRLCTTQAPCRTFLTSL